VPCRIVLASPEDGPYHFSLDCLKCNKEYKCLLYCCYW